MYALDCYTNVPVGDGSQEILYSRNLISALLHRNYCGYFKSVTGMNEVYFLYRALVRGLCILKYFNIHRDLFYLRRRPWSYVFCTSDQPRLNPLLGTLLFTC